ncbi:MAG: AAA family ATPase [Sphingomicrobium sp.]
MKGEWHTCEPEDAPRPAWLRGISAAALMAKQFAPFNYVITGLIGEGANLFGGKPKIGKSWMAFQFAIAKASGLPLFGTIPVAIGDVLYLALEDNERKLKSRMLKMGVQAPDRLTLATEWPDLEHGCIEEMAAWADAVAHPSLIIVDVLKMIRGPSRNSESLYDGDYRALAGLAAFARSRSLAVLVVHHVRKMEAEDPLESLSGTNGLTGAADTVLGHRNRTLPAICPRPRRRRVRKGCPLQTGQWDMGIARQRRRGRPHRRAPSNPRCFASTS